MYIIFHTQMSPLYNVTVRFFAVLTVFIAQIAKTSQLIVSLGWEVLYVILARNPLVILHNGADLSLYLPLT